MPPEHSRFAPGQSGNPSGKLKGSFSIRAALKRKLAADPGEHGTGRIADALADLLIREAIDSDRIHALIHEIEGKPTEYVERTDNSTRTIVVKPGAVTPPEMP